MEDQQDLELRMGRVELALESLRARLEEIEDRLLPPAEPPSPPGATQTQRLSIPTDVSLPPSFEQIQKS
jgi:hypothetical protein